MKTTIISILIATCLLACKRQGEHIDDKISKKYVQSFDSIYTAGSTSGATLIYDPNSQTYYCNDTTTARKGTVPASTFKIANSIIGMQSGNVNPDTSIFRWDGQTRLMKQWETDQSLKQAFKNSCVPCYQELAKRVGLDTMVYYLDILNYGNMVFDSTSLDIFWLRGESKINLFEQVEFIEKIFTKKLPIAKAVNDQIIDIMKIEKETSYTMYGKTGLAILEKENIGWFVGALEMDSKLYYFATRLTEAPGNYKELIDKRIKNTTDAFRSLNIIK